MRLKVLIGCIDFNNYTGSELYYYELAKELVKLNCDVTICSNLAGGDLSHRTSKLGIKTCSLNEPVGYKLGDGKWLTNQNGHLIVSQPNQLYNVLPFKFDVLCLSHQPIINYLINLYPNTPVLSINHSEVIDLENPVIHPQIKKYVAIRPEIKDYMVNNFNIPENIIDIVYNPIDCNRFRIKDKEIRDKKRVLFVGSLHDLREKTILDLIEKTKANNEEFWIVGRNHGLDMNKMLRENSHIKHFNAEWGVEKYIHQCDETAGVLLGRTTIESWMCGKPSWIYDIDKYGNINSKKLYSVPDNLDRFKSDLVGKEIKEKLLNII